MRLLLMRLLAIATFGPTSAILTATPAHVISASSRPGGIAYAQASTTNGVIASGAEATFVNLPNNVQRYADTVHRRAARDLEADRLRLMGQARTPERTQRD